MHRVVHLSSAVFMHLSCLLGRGYQEGLLLRLPPLHARLAVCRAQHAAAAAAATPSHAETTMSSNHHHHAAALLFLAAAALPLARSSSLCLAHPSCPPVHATHCCPTATNKQLSCCDNGAPIRPLCAANPSCARLAPSPGDLCCPDADGIFAPCCPGAWVDGAPLLPLVQPKSALAEAVPLAIDGKDLIRGSEFLNSFNLTLLELSLWLAPGELPLPGQRSHWEPPSFGSRSFFASTLGQGGVPTALTQGP